MLYSFKKQVSLLLLIIFALLSGNIFAQEEPAPPLPPDMPMPRLFDKQTESQYLKSLNKMMRAKLNNIKKFDRKAYERLLQKSYFNSMDIPFFNAFDKERQETRAKISSLEIETTSLAMSYKNDKNVDKNKIKSKLTKKLNELFTIKEKNKKQDVLRLEKQLKDLKHSLKVRNKKRKEIITRRLNELIGEEKYLDWND